MVGAFIDTSNPDIVTTDMVFRHVDHMAELVGIDHVGFGSDYIPDITWSANVIQQPMGQVVFPDGGYSARMGAKGCSDAGAVPDRRGARRHDARGRIHRRGLRQVPRRQHVPRPQQVWK